MPSQKLQEEFPPEEVMIGGLKAEGRRGAIGRTGTASPAFSPTLVRWTGSGEAKPCRVDWRDENRPADGRPVLCRAQEANFTKIDSSEIRGG